MPPRADDAVSLEQQLASLRAENKALMLVKEKYRALKGKLYDIARARSDRECQVDGSVGSCRMECDRPPVEHAEMPAAAPALATKRPRLTGTRAELAPTMPHVQVVRKKQARAQLTGRTCKACEDFYRATGLAATNACGECSRHRSLYKSPETPPGFWKVDFDEDLTECPL